MEAQTKEEIDLINSKLDVIASHLAILEKKNAGFFEKFKPSFLKKKDVLSDLKNIPSIVKMKSSSFRMNED